MTETHLLVQHYPPAGLGPQIVETFSTYQLALAAHAGVTKAYPEAALTYAVRSSDDPQWRTRVARADRSDPVARTARLAAAAWRTKEIRAAASWAIRSKTDASFDGLVVAARKTALEHGIGQVERFEVEDAVKAKVTIARCRKTSGRSYRPSGCDRAYWMPRSAGKIGDHSCPHCGNHLAQTTLAYQRTFLPLLVEAARLAEAR
jgi:hypothetical protein